MRAPTAGDAAQARDQANTYAARPGTRLWLAAVRADLERGDVDRWAREMLRALGWPLALPGGRVRHGRADTDFHRLDQLEALPSDLPEAGHTLIWTSDRLAEVAADNLRIYP